MLLRSIFSRRWWLATVLALIGTLVLIRLGIWQLDRLSQRRAFNAQVIAARAQAPLDLNQGIPDNIDGMEWRQVQLTGQYDFVNQIVVRNQYNGNQLGYHLLTPMLFNIPAASNQTPLAVLVDRGWIPADGNSTPDAWRNYDETGTIKVTGQIRLGQGKPALGGVADTLPADGSKLFLWNNADLEQVKQQIPYPILPVYVQLNADPADTTPPIPSQPELDLSEGPHMGYALQWFTFAAILFFGYPYYVRKQESSRI